MLFVIQFYLLSNSVIKNPTLAKGVRAKVSPIFVLNYSALDFFYIFLAIVIDVFSAQLVMELIL